MGRHVRQGHRSEGQRHGSHHRARPPGSRAITSAFVAIGLCAAVVLALVAAGVFSTSAPGTSLPGAGAPSAAISAGHATTSSTVTPPKPATTTPRPPDPFTLPAVTSYLATRQGDVTAGIDDLTTGQTWLLKPGDAQDTASVVKVDILSTLLSQVQPAGGLPPPDQQALATTMIEESDNDAATDLWNAAGGAPGLQAFNGHAGMTETTPSACVACPNFPWPGWGLTTTTPADQLTLLKQLVKPSHLLSTAQQQYVLGLMEQVTPSERWGVTGGVPAGVTVALKNGWLPLDDTDTVWQINSIGWVDGQGRDYLAAVFTTGDPSMDYGIDTINGLSALFWNALAPG